MGMWENTFSWFCQPKGNETAFFGALQDRNVLIEWHLANCAADENWAMTAKVQGQKRKRKLFHLEVKVIWNKWFHI